MSGFTARWLDLREAVDARSRSPALAQELLRAVGTRAPLRLLDLGTGTGANLRYLAPLLHRAQEWLLLDHDDALLALLSQRMGAGRFDCCYSTSRIDLARPLPAAVLAGQQVVTASALLDLVSASWLLQLATSCSRVGAIALFALNYDGRMRLTPADPCDELVRQLVNLHQHGDKGFGPALGPQACRYAQSVFDALGYRSRCEGSDWNVLAAEGVLQRELLDGWVAAAVAAGPQAAAQIESWRQRRLAHLDKGRSTMQVGHQDFIAWPAGAA